ncbi:peptidoglycan -binding protein [Nereida ignava]|uniref:Chemotaxis protein MotB n=1 Tax=Nereida ignava TaxID=282199 RepID=A0A0U1NND0_9RHOB|nr:peptidoglycan -binding protein [Nereida ignava]CRK76003.1 Chemotaxis protein MotB [Nereida ignava]SFJ67084.1 chemotaxis protein MotB [Nereida ignava DSM 16309]
MALAQRRNGIQASIWPGFVDAMTALLLVLMFVLTIFMVVQAVLRETITGQENELNELGAEVGALSAALGLATSQRDDLRVELGSLRATLSQAEDDIDARDARIRDFEAQVAALLVQQSQTQAQITALQGENAQILSDKEALDLALAAARDEISAGEQAARLAAARREALEALIADLRAENTETTALLSQTEQALTDAQQELSDAEIARIADAQAAAALRARLEAAQDELTATTLALEAKRQEAEDTLTVLAATQETRDDLNARLAQALLDLEQTDAELGALQDRVDADAASVQAELSALLAAKLAAENEAALRLTEAQQRAALLAEANEELSVFEAQSAEDQRKITLLNQQIGELRSQLSSLQGILDAAAEADAQADIQIQTLGQNLNAALARAATEERKRRRLEEAERKRLEAEAVDLAKYRSDFFAQLRDLLDGQDGVRIEGDRFVFSSEVLFAQGQADLSADGEAEIAKVARILRDIAGDIPDGIDWVIRVDGHTDDIPLSGLGEFRNNWELSQARALSVVLYMVNFLGLPPDRLAANGFGQYQPVNPADTDAARAQNRRIELKLTEK